MAKTNTNKAASSKTATTETKAAAAAKAETAEPAASGNSIPKSSLTSAVTSDLPQEAPVEPTEADKARIDAFNATMEGRALEAGIGLIHVDGIDFRYVGVAPARDKDAKTESGLAISPLNSTFTPLSNVPFSNSIRVKDPASGKFYFPADGVTSWEGVEFEGSKLIPAAKKAKA